MSTRSLRRALIIAAAALAMVAGTLGVVDSAFAHTANAPVSAVAIGLPTPGPRIPAPVASPTCSRPAPRTAAGYSAMFAALPTSQWGAADLSISVPMGHRVVWLYGDTFEANLAHGFVHSSAIVQTGGCLHVSSGGAQLLPNDDSRHIYWITSARATSASTLRVQARAITLTGTGPWDFHDAGFARTASVVVSALGDLSVRSWGPRQASPAPAPGPLVDLGHGHVQYARHVHPEARLAGARTLVTWCQNWERPRRLASGALDFAAYRPVFSAI